MSGNTIRARMEFSFRGEAYELDTLIDLDRCLRDAREEPNFHSLLAKAAGIDAYSYLYEVMESHDIEFSQATGLAAPCCLDGAFDWFRYLMAVREEADLSAVRAIAEQTLGVSDLDDRSDLKAALLAAYRAGQASGA